MTVKASILVSTFRPGGLDVLFAGLQDQTFRDFEVILIDHRYEHRHRRTKAMAVEYGLQNFIHVPEHRRNGKWLSLASGWNTGMALAQGEVILFSMDWTYTPPGWIESHLKFHEENPRCYVAAPYRYMSLPPLKFKKTFNFEGQRDRGAHCTEADEILTGGILDELRAFQVPFRPEQLKSLIEAAWPDQDPRTPQDQIPDTWIHLKNESIRRETAFELNGLDERLDRGKGPIDTDWGLRMAAAGIELLWNNDGMARCLDPRSIIRTMPWGDIKERLEGRWSYDDGLAYNQLRRTEISQGGSTRAKNPWNIESLAEAIYPWRVKLPSSALAGIDVSDASYWGKEIWPDTP